MVTPPTLVSGVTAREPPPTFLPSALLPAEPRSPLEAAIPSNLDASEDDARLSRAILAHLRTQSAALALVDAHEHALAARDAWPWLPTREHRHLAVHPYCASCGGVKYVGSLGALPLGGLINLAAALRTKLQAQGRKVSEAQMRLIFRRLREAQASDRFTHSRATQEALLLDAFSHFTRLEPAVLASYLRSD